MTTIQVFTITTSGNIKTNRKDQCSHCGHLESGRRVISLINIEFSTLLSFKETLAPYHSIPVISNHNMQEWLKRGTNMHLILNTPSVTQFTMQLLCFKPQFFNQQRDKSKCVMVSSRVYSTAAKYFNYSLIQTLFLVTQSLDNYLYIEIIASQCKSVCVLVHATSSA